MRGRQPREAAQTTDAATTTVALTAAPPAALEVSDIQVRYAGVPAVKGVDANSSTTTFNAFVLGLGGRADAITIDDVVVTKTP